MQTASTVPTCALNVTWYHIPLFIYTTELTKVQLFATQLKQYYITHAVCTVVNKNVFLKSLENV